jgi:glucose/mannose transport system substrate-binding protein
MRASCEDDPSGVGPSPTCTNTRRRHRSNVVFFNRAALVKGRVPIPAQGYAMPAFLADLAKIRQSGGTPLCLGGKDPFAAAELFESVLLTGIGPAGWAGIIADRFDWSGPQARAALTAFGTILDQADPANPGLTWDQATGKPATGDCAFEAFNDSAYGELIADRATEQTIRDIAFPGTDGAYVAIVDAFAVGNGAADHHRASCRRRLQRPRLPPGRRLEGGDTGVQPDQGLGARPHRRGHRWPVADQRDAAKALREQAFLLSIVHCEAMSPTFQQGLYDAVATYRTSRDPAQFTKTLTAAVLRGRGVTVP